MSHLEQYLHSTKIRLDANGNFYRFQVGILITKQLVYVYKTNKYSFYQCLSLLFTVLALSGI
jgi:hypothetical protein